MATRVLLLDDDPQDRFLATRALGREFQDLAVTEVRDQGELDAALRRLDFDVIVTDYRLRWTDGLQVLSAMQAAGADIPVVMFTNTGNEELAATGLRAGLADYIIKTPTHYGRLAHAVRIAMQNARSARREREARERERRALRTAEEALRLKDEFLATLSHELRTPLNAISGWVQILRSNPEPGRVDRGLTAIERNTAVLTRLIEDLVDVSRIVTGNLKLHIRPTDFRPVIEAALDAVRPAAHAKHLDIRTIAVPGAAPVAADADRLQQIVWNLLSNAVKFTPSQGRIEIGLQPDGSAMVLTVADTGPGIPGDFLPRVFDRFSQQDGSPTRAHGGMGLGLAIVRHLADLHGGSASVSSTPGQGTTFTVRIPMADPQDRRPPASPRTLPGGMRLEGLHVLVVDDDADAREVLEHIIEDEGATVTAVNSAAEAYEVLKCRPADIVVCDIGMPGEDGLAFIRRVRTDAEPAIASIPAIAVTAYARDEDRAESLQAGYQSHVPKPVAGPDLVALIDRVAHGEVR